jgi:lipopolysaccharide/colanic/teichoic acid biosynthesis glycosyltransferase
VGVTSEQTSKTHSTIVAHVSWKRRITLFAKRVFDVVDSLFLLIVLFPLMTIIAIAIKLEDPGPLIYRRQVFGRGGKPFMAFKFRSMVANAHELLAQNATLLQQYQQSLKIADDPRVTRVGRILRKLSFDELPQLVNVLRGEMALVGPRILGDIELARYGEYREKVLSVKPGITGLWQVSGRHTVSFEKRVELDMYYVDHWNLWMDFFILLKTIPAVITGKGAE